MLNNQKQEREVDIARVNAVVMNFNSLLTHWQEREINVQAAVRQRAIETIFIELLDLTIRSMEGNQFATLLFHYMINHEAQVFTEYLDDAFIELLKESESIARACSEIALSFNKQSKLRGSS